MGFLPFFSVETWILLITFICAFYMYGTWNYGLFEKLGVPCAKPRMFFGTIGRHDLVYYLDDVGCMKKFGRIWGMYEFRKPVLFVMEPDMLKTILVKECFTYFTNRRNFGLNGDLYDSVSIVEDDHWRRLRSIITPSFSSGHIKAMFNHMKHHSHKLTACLRSKADNGEVIKVKEFFGAYSMDVMASSALTVDMDLINDRSGALITHGSKMFRFATSVFILLAWFPALLPLFQLMGFALFNRDSTKFFKKLLDKIRSDRDRSSHKNEDFLQDMINIQADESKEKKHNLTDHEINSQVTMFIFAGYETSASTLSFLAYNLARNPEVMKRLQEEIDTTFPNKNPVQYETLMQMEYLDCVVNESLRLFPPAARLERVAKETVKINGITIPKGMIVTVPSYAMHRDPDLWPEPEEFKPERFSKENKANINPYTYLPFGVGPRNCLGMRFALAGVKLALVEVLRNYSFSVCEETEFPLKMDPAGLVGPLKPIQLKLLTR